MKRALLTAALLLSLSVGAMAQTTSVPPLMNFQGRLAKPDGTPVTDGNYSLTFRIFAAPTGGTALWTQTVSAARVRNGTFAVLLGSGNALTADIFNGTPYFEIQVGSNAPLTPRQQLATVAFAFKANTVPDGAITTSKLADSAITTAKLAPGAVTNTTITSLDARKITNTALLPFWSLTGNTGTLAGQSFLGTTDASPLELRVHSMSALRLVESTDGSGTYGINVIGGFSGNSIINNATGATVWGGFIDSFGPAPNMVTYSGGTVSGGIRNSADFLAVVGGGASNTAGNMAATVAGGLGNNATTYAAVGGGIFNVASGEYSTIAGGSSNATSGDYSFAAGQQAQANHDGAFVWNDASNTTANNAFVSTGVNQFLVHATGGMGINTNAPGGYALNVNGTGKFSGSLTVNTTTYTSDARYKRDIATLENPLETVLNLRGVSYAWRRGDYPEMNFADGRQIGFIAQEVEKVLPTLVNTDNKGYKSVAYANIVPILVEAIKAQQKKINALEQQNMEIADLKAQVAALTAMMKADKNTIKVAPK